MSTYGMPLTIDEAFAVVKRSAEEEARDSEHERNVAANRSWLLACDASSAINQTYEHLRDDEVSLEKRMEVRDVLVEMVERAQKALAENDRAIERQSFVAALPFSVAA
jgi:hypothetical protein